MAYLDFAKIYDEVMHTVDYPLWAEYVLNLAANFGFRSQPLLNLACGTASLEIELDRLGIQEMVSLDASGEMLAEAKGKCLSRGIRPDFIHAKMQDFQLDRTFPLILCLYDSVNYLTSEEDVTAFLECARRHLEPGGGLIFDVTTEYNIVAHFADALFFENKDDYSYIWENSYNIQSKVILSRLTIFLREGEVFRRHTEDHYQKIYSIKRVRELIEMSGFEVLGAFHDYTMGRPRKTSERIHFVCRRPEREVS